MRLLLVEDDPMVGESIRDGLAQEGFTVDWVRDGAAADAALGTEPYAAVLLDLGLPRKDGLDVLRAARARRNDVPILVITARDGARREVPLTLRIDTAIEVDYYKHGGILPFVLRQLLAA